LKAILEFLALGTGQHLAVFAPVRIAGASAAFTGDLFWLNRLVSFILEKLDYFIAQLFVPMSSLVDITFCAVQTTYRD
jgi:hypothetical protein